MRVQDTWRPDLQHNVEDNDEEWEGEIEEEPDLHRFNPQRAGEGGGDREVDGGEDHHAGDVDGDHQVGLPLQRQVVGGLVDDVHQDGGQVDHHEDTQKVPIR